MVKKHLTHKDDLSSGNSLHICPLKTFDTKNTEYLEPRPTAAIDPGVPSRKCRFRGPTVHMHEHFSACDRNV